MQGFRKFRVQGEDFKRLRIRVLEGLKMSLEALQFGTSSLTVYGSGMKVQALGWAWSLNPKPLLPIIPSSLMW